MINLQESMLRTDNVVALLHVNTFDGGLDRKYALSVPRQE